MINAEIEYELKMNAGSHKGQIVHIKTNLEELEQEGLPIIIIREGYLECWCNKDEYRIRSRKITVTQD